MASKNQVLQIYHVGCAKNIEKMIPIETISWLNKQV